MTPANTDTMLSRATSASWWFRSADGRLTLWQFPNPALALWLATVVIGLFPLTAAHANTLGGVRRGALLVWSLDELLRGASPFRRVLGAVVLVAQVLSLARAY